MYQVFKSQIRCIDLHFNNLVFGHIFNKKGIFFSSKKLFVEKKHVY